jgi:hypothetical protein
MEIYQEVLRTVRSRKRAFAAALEYQNVATESVLDRKATLLKLKIEQDQWCPSESINKLQAEVSDLSTKFQKLKQLEETLSPLAIATQVYTSLSVDHLRTKNPPIQGGLFKQSIKFSKLQRGYSL